VERCRGFAQPGEDRGQTLRYGTAQIAFPAA
jgi:hypothetical protein